MDSSSEIDGCSLLTVFWGHRLVQFLLFADYAVLPAALLKIREDFDMTHLEIGFAGMLVYAGLGCSTLFCGAVMNRWGSRVVLEWSLPLAAISTLACAAAPEKIVFMVARFLCGFMQGPAYVFAPVWVDAFAPSGSETSWMGIQQLTGPIANMISYAATAVLVHVFGMSWRMSYLPIGLGILLSGVVARYVPEKLWQAENGESDAVHLGRLFRYPVFWILCIVSAIGYYTLTGMEFTAMLKLLTLGDPKEKAWAHYCAVGIFGMMPGTYLGCRFMDTLGGYRQRKVALRFCLLLTVLALSPAHFYLYSTDLPLALLSLTVSCFCVGAVMPVLWGLCIDSVASEMRVYASSLLTFMVDTFGCMVAPPLLGHAQQLYGVAEAWRWCFYPAIFAPICIAFALFLEPAPLPTPRTSLIGANPQEFDGEDEPLKGQSSLVDYSTIA